MAVAVEKEKKERKKQFSAVLPPLARTILKTA
jgi:hypothetical protein